MHCAHLIGDRANATDARHNVRNFRDMTPAKKGFEQTRRFENLQLDVGHLITLQLDEQGALSFHPRQSVHFDGSLLFGRRLAHDRSHSSLALRNCHAQALNARKDRAICWSLWPRTRNWPVRDAVLVVSMGP